MFPDTVAVACARPPFPIRHEGFSRHVCRQAAAGDRQQCAAVLNFLTMLAHAAKRDHISVHRSIREKLKRARDGARLDRAKNRSFKGQVF